MLEVMSTGLPYKTNDRDLLMNCWDNSSPLIKELERTVNFAERKCGDLMQQLHYYKEYYEKWAQVERINHLCHKKKIKKYNEESQSSFENEFEKANQCLYQKIQNKIHEMNDEISQANRKLHIKSEEKPSTPTKHSQTPQPAFEGIDNKACKSEPTMSPCERKKTTEGLKITEKQSSKSVPARSRVLKNAKKDLGIGKRRFSNLQRYKLRSKSLPQGVRRKFGFGGFFEVREPETVLRENARSRSRSKTLLKSDSFKTIRSRKSKTKLGDPRSITLKNSRHAVTKSKSDTKHFRNDYDIKNENNRPMSEIFQKPQKKVVNVCKDLVPSSMEPNIELTPSSNLKNLFAKPNRLLPFLRNPIPFIPCSSTSKSFNLGLNVQQVLSLIKHKKHSVMLQTIVRNSMQAARSVTEPTVDTLFISQTTTSHSHVTSAICPAREGSEDGFSIVTENRSKCSILKQVQTIRSRAVEDKVCCSEESSIQTTKMERPEDVWVVEQPDPASKDVKKTRSKCTCFPSKHCVDYHKVLRQYTGYRLPAGSQPDSHSTYVCTKSKLYAIPSQDNLNFGTDGADGKSELVKVHNDLLNLTRKYSTLQEHISQNGLNDYEANAELDAMESELAIREIEFKDILNFYNQLMVLKEKLKSLRARNERSPITTRPDCQRPKKDPLRPTPSMALARVLKKIQGLQDKIKLIDAP